MVIALGSDHASFELKEEIKKNLAEQKIEFKDFGTNSCNSVDYPEFGFKVANAVANGEYPKGILFCGSGIGMSIVANKVPKIRAALCNDVYTAKLSREHNDANILVLAGRIIGIGLAKEIVKVWLNTKFSEEKRHADRISQISDIERKYCK
ncbi:MAG: ribose 5-phosphate isomerase B [Candidatus Firestonebacteria bacterium]